MKPLPQKTYLYLVALLSLVACAKPLPQQKHYDMTARCQPELMQIITAFVEQNHHNHIYYFWNSGYHNTMQTYSLVGLPRSTDPLAYSVKNSNSPNGYYRVGKSLVFVYDNSPNISEPINGIDLLKESGVFSDPTTYQSWDTLKNEPIPFDGGFRCGPTNYPSPYILLISQSSQREYLIDSIDIHLPNEYPATFGPPPPPTRPTVRFVPPPLFRKPSNPKQAIIDTASNHKDSI